MSRSGNTTTWRRLKKAVGFLGSEKKFADFVAKRDPLLSGEENRFLQLADGAVAPALPEPAKFVIHEVHRVPLSQQAAYLEWLKAEGLPALKQHEFRPAGPWMTAIGKWSEVTLLFRFESLTERDRLIARFMATADGRKYGQRVGELTDEITTRLLMPASFAKPPAPDQKKSASAPAASSVLPHLERVSPNVFAAGFGDKYRSANCGFFAADNGSVLIDPPRGIPVADCVREVERLTGRPPRRLLLTHADKDDLALVTKLVAAGIQEVIATPATRVEPVFLPRPAE